VRRVTRTKFSVWAVIVILLLVGALSLRGVRVGSGRAVPGDTREEVLATMQAEGFQWPSPTQLSVTYAGKGNGKVAVEGLMKDPLGSPNPTSSSWDRLTVAYEKAGSKWVRVPRSGFTPGIGGSTATTRGMGGY
jgi:hypothetical protein